ncbi:hypothetical protein MFRU_003g03810 [Monilinia fructicola]|nr:hypothetical protein MFRU_003g03810 [Monilinia fructicola]
MLVDTNHRDTKTVIFSLKVSAPIGFAPITINCIYNPLAELPLAKLAKELNLSYCLSTAGSTSIEDVGAANGASPRVFHLYMPHDDEVTLSLLQRAHDSGIVACILTLDTWQLAWRHRDAANSNSAFYHGVGADLGLSDPPVGDTTYVMFDSGFRVAADVLKALAPGANIVFVGRLWVWGLSIKGELGV